MSKAKPFIVDNQAKQYLDKARTALNVSIPKALRLLAKDVANDCDPEYFSDTLIRIHNFGGNLVGRR